MKNEIMVKGEDLNAQLLSVIRNRRKAILEDGKKANIPGVQANLYEIDKNKGEYIQQEDKEEYDCLNELENIFFKYGENDVCSDHDLYDIPGVKITINGEEKEVPLNIRIEKIRDLAQKASDYERILGHSIRIKFPNQIYQFKHEGSKVPGTNYEAMRPKFAFETPEEYEEQIKLYYKVHGLKSEQTEDGKYRKPFPHEKTNYKGEHPELKEDNQSEYYAYHYSQILRNAAPQQTNQTPTNNQTQPGQQGPQTQQPRQPQPAQQQQANNGRRRVTSAEVFNYQKPGALQTLKTFFGGVKGSWSNDDTRRKIKYAVATTGLVGVGLYAGFAVGILPAAIPAATILSVFGWAMNRKRKKLIAAAKGQNNGGTPTPTPTPAPSNGNGNTPTNTQTRTQSQQQPQQTQGGPTPPRNNNGGNQTPPPNNNGNGPTPPPNNGGRTTPQNNTGGGATPPVPPTPSDPSRPNSGGAVDPTNNPNMVSLGEDLQAILESLNQNYKQIRRIDSEIALARENISQLNPSSPDYEKVKNALDKKLARLQKQQRQILENLKADIDTMLSSYYISNENGGPKL